MGDARPAIAAFDLSLTGPAGCVDGTLTSCDTRKKRGHDRLETIVRWVLGHTCRAGAPSVDVVAIEGFAYGAKGRGALSLAGLGWIVRHELHNLRVPYLEVPPTCVKKYATGKGNANKDDVLAAAIRRGGDLFAGTSNDEADAWWIWALTCDLYGAPVVDVPASHRTALDKLDPVDLAA